MNSTAAEMQQKSDHTITGVFLVTARASPKGELCFPGAELNPSLQHAWTPPCPPALPKSGWHLCLPSIYSDVKSSFPPAVLL